MPEKEGAEEKSTKSVVNKKQKQMMGEEGYDIARDMGRVRPSKDKKDATTMPPSKEMEKTRKVNKGPSALELVKKKYKGQIMDVGKKKVKEELDLTQVAEALGGYITEVEIKGKGPIKKIVKDLKKKGEIDPQADTAVGNQIAPNTRKVTTQKVVKTQDPDQAARDAAFKAMRMSDDPDFREPTDDVKKGLRDAQAGKYKEYDGKDPTDSRKPRKKLTPAQKEAELEGKRKDYLDPKTNKASPEGVKKYITKARQMRSGSNVPVDQETTDNIAKIAGKEYADKINQKYGGRRAGRRQSTFTPPAFATRTGESGGPLPVSMRNRRVPKTSSLSTPVTTTPTFKGFQDKVKEVTPEIVFDRKKDSKSKNVKGQMGGQTVDTTATRVNGRTGQRNIFTGEPEPPKDETRQRQFKPDPNYIRMPRGFNPDQLELDFNRQQQRQQQLPPSQKPDIDKLLDRTRRKKFSPSFIPTMEPRREPETQTQTDGGGNNKKPPTISVATPDGGGKRKFSAFNSIRQFAKDNPAAALAGYDLGKGILGKIMKYRPSLKGGRAGLRSAAR